MTDLKSVSTPRLVDHHTLALRLSLLAATVCVLLLRRLLKHRKWRVSRRGRVTLPVHSADFFPKLGNLCTAFPTSAR